MQVPTEKKTWGTHGVDGMTDLMNRVRLMNRDHIIVFKASSYLRRTMSRKVKEFRQKQKYVKSVLSGKLKRARSQSVDRKRQMMKVMTEDDRMLDRQGEWSSGLTQQLLAIHHIHAVAQTIKEERECKFPVFFSYFVLVDERIRLSQYKTSMGFITESFASPLGYQTIKPEALHTGEETTYPRCLPERKKCDCGAPHRPAALVKDKYQSWRKILLEAFFFREMVLLSCNWNEVKMVLKKPNHRRRIWEYITKMKGHDQQQNRCSTERSINDRRGHRVRSARPLVTVERDLKWEVRGRTKRGQKAFL